MYIWLVICIYIYYIYYNIYTLCIIYVLYIIYCIYNILNIYIHRKSSILISIILSIIPSPLFTFVSQRWRR